MAASVTQLDYCDDIPDPVEATPLPVLQLPEDGPYFGPNRRFLPRVAETFVVRLHDGSGTLDGIDISFGGLMCSAETPVWPGNLLDVDVLLPGDTQPIAARCRVMELVTFRHRIAMRVRFEDLSLARRKQIAMWMAQRAGVR